MSDNRIETRADGMAERIGDSLGLVVVLVVYAGIAWMMEVAFKLSPGRILHCRQHPRAACPQGLLWGRVALASGLLRRQGRAAVDASRPRNANARGCVMTRPHDQNLTPENIVAFLGDIFKRSVGRGVGADRA
jgi:hypothetical protein